MKIMIVYDIASGNPQIVTEAMGKALAGKAYTKVLRVDRVKPVHLARTELLIFGSPNPRFNPAAPVKQFLDDISRGSLDGIPVAAYDIRFTEDEILKPKVLEFFVNIFGYAAKSISKKWVKKGGPYSIHRKGFMWGEGPWLDGVLERAAARAETVYNHALSLSS